MADDEVLFIYTREGTPGLMSLGLVLGPEAFLT